MALIPNSSLEPETESLAVPLPAGGNAEPTPAPVVPTIPGASQNEAETLPAVLNIRRIEPASMKEIPAPPHLRTRDADHTPELRVDHADQRASSEQDTSTRQETETSSLQDASRPGTVGGDTSSHSNGFRANGNDGEAARSSDAPDDQKWYDADLEDNSDPSIGDRPPDKANGHARPRGTTFDNLREEQSRRPTYSNAAPSPSEGEYRTEYANVFVHLADRPLNQNETSAGKSFRPYRWFGLAPWGLATMSPRARIDMYWASVILCCVALLDWLGWTVFWNEVLNLGVLTFHPLKTPAAFFAGALFTLPLLAYERGFLTIDTLTAGWTPQIKSMVRYRVGLIIVAAVITTQPLELFFLNSEISARIHEEGIRAELVRMSLPVSDGKTAADDRIEQLRGDETKAQQNLEQAREQESQATTAREFATARERQTETSRDKAQTALNTVSALLSRTPATASDYATTLKRRGDAEAALKEAVKAVTNSQTALKKAQEAEAATHGAVAGRQNDIGDIEGRINNRLALSDLEIQARGEYLRLVKQSKPGQKVCLSDVLDRMRTQQGAKAAASPQGAETGCLQDPAYGPGDKLRILWDHLTGAPPLWPGIGEKDAQRYRDRYSLNDPERRASFLSLLPWLSVTLMGLIVPLLSLLFKRVMHEDLTMYYSTIYQAAHGNPEAIRFSKAEEEFRSKTEETRETIMRKTEAGSKRQSRGPGGEKGDSDNPPNENPREGIGAVEGKNP